MAHHHQPHDDRTDPNRLDRRRRTSTGHALLKAWQRGHLMRYRLRDKGVRTPIEHVQALTRGPLLFWQRSLQNPRQICSLFPSSPFVGKAMTHAILDRPARGVVELGAGTGAITRQLLRHGVAREDLTLLEIDHRLGAHLRQTFPGVHVLVASAERLADMWTARHAEPAGAVLSTLPLRLFSDDLIRSVVANSFSVLAPAGKFVQFTYRQRSPVPTDIVQDLGLVAVRHAVIWANLPPAMIWVYQRG